MAYPRTLVQGERRPHSTRPAVASCGQPGDAQESFVQMALRDDRSFEILVGYATALVSDLWEESDKLAPLMERYKGCDRKPEDIRTLRDLVRDKLAVIRPGHC